MVGSATNRLCQFWQYACVYECVNVHLETLNGQYTDMSTYTRAHSHTHTLRIMGGRNLLRPHPLDSQGDTIRSVGRIKKTKHRVSPDPAQEQDTQPNLLSLLSGIQGF